MSTSRAPIGWEQIGLGAILGSYRLGVPPNQREYSWTVDEVGTLFEDLQRAIDADDPEYFLGTIVTIPRALPSIEVVDGQQRLATTAIFLAEVRNYLQDKEPLIAESITNDFLCDIDRATRERAPKLKLNVDDNEFFRKMVTASDPASIPKPDKPRSHRLIWEAFEKSRERIRFILGGRPVKDHGDALNRWVHYLQYLAQVVLLKVPSAMNAYKMFETLNDRGLKTSQADLVKSYLFEMANDGGRLAEAQQKWSFMKGALESLEDDDIIVDFLRHALMAMTGYLKEESVLERVQARVKGAPSAIDFLASVESLSGVYVSMFNPEHEKWNGYPPGIRRAIQTLNMLNIKPLRPLMLASANAFSAKEATNAFQAFITWAVRLLIAASTRSESVIEPMATAANKVFNATIKDAKALKSELKNIIPLDEQFRGAFEVASISKSALARYYLRSLEMAAKNEATPWFIPNDDAQVINLEHVLPEKRELADWPDWDEEKSRAYVRRLGNMALLLAKGNSDLKSSDFNTKKGVYKDSPYELTRQIAQVAKWTDNEIAKRQKTLADLALKTWPL